MPHPEYHIYWTKTAQNDLLHIMDYIQKDKKFTAKYIFNKIKEKSQKLSNHAFMDRIIPELEFFNIYIYREIIESPWRIIYKIEEKNIYIIAVIDGRRDLNDILIERILKN